MLAPLMIPPFPVPSLTAPSCFSWVLLFLLLAVVVAEFTALAPVFALPPCTPPASIKCSCTSDTVASFVPGLPAGSGCAVTLLYQGNRLDPAALGTGASVGASGVIIVPMSNKR